jgi:hypothetical protein
VEFLPRVPAVHPVNFRATDWALSHLQHINVIDHSFYLERHTLLKIQEQVKHGRNHDECRMLNAKRSATGEDYQPDLIIHRS